MQTTNFLRPVVIQYHRNIEFPYKGNDPLFNWSVIMATKVVEYSDDALALSKNMIKVLYHLITTGGYIPKIEFIKDFDKNRVSYDETDNSYVFIRYHFSDNFKNYTEDDEEFYDDTAVIFMGTYMDLQPNWLKDSDKYEYYDVDEADDEISNEGYYFLNQFEDQYYAIALNSLKDGIIGKSNTLDGALIELEKYLSKTFNLPECIYFDCDVEEANVWISKKEQ